MDEIIRLASILREKIENYGLISYLTMSEEDKIAFNIFHNSIGKFLKNKEKKDATN